MLYGQSKFLIALVPSWRIVKGVAVTQLDKVIAWFWTWLLEGKFPLTDFYKQEWPKNSWRAKVAGSNFADGWRMAFDHLRGDEEYLVSTFKWNGYMHNLC